ncbi:hypothetical protein MTO96_048985 [Rhipicephalus appendiculatus]
MTSRFPPHAGGGGPWCGLHGDTEKWMKDVLRRFRRGPREKRRAHKLGRVGRKLQAAAKASSDDKMEGVVQVGAAGDVNRDETEGGGGYEHDYEGNDDDEDRGTPTEKSGRHPRGSSASRRVCNLEITVDHTLFERFYREGDTFTFTRQKLVTAIAIMVKKVNEIYASTNFGGVEDIHFLVQHIVISEPDDCVGARKKKNPFCYMGIDAPQALFLVSLEPRDDYCLSYRLNYRDFMDGNTRARLDCRRRRCVGTGGFCERYRSAIEVDPSGDRYVQSKLSLNTGITTLLNYNHYVGLHVASLTFAHEIGHSFGSPHDDGRECVPRGSEGKYLMYESATRGTAPNNDRFSPCSIRNITAILLPVIEGKSNRENCLQRHKGPICGNQIVEGEEECDCGRDEKECSDKCCHPRHSKDSTLACRLKESAACRRVPCGRTLSTLLVPLTSHCRCTGENATCPQAPVKANLTACNKNTQVCIAGECSGSICEKYGLVECYPSGDELSIEEQCLLTCREPAPLVSPARLFLRPSGSVLTPRQRPNGKDHLEVLVEQTLSGDTDSNTDAQSRVIFSEFEFDVSRLPKE